MRLIMGPTRADSEGLYTYGMSLVSAISALANNSSRVWHEPRFSAVRYDPEAQFLPVQSGNPNCSLDGQWGQEDTFFAVASGFSFAVGNIPLGAAFGVIALVSEMMRIGSCTTS